MVDFENHFLSQCRGLVLRDLGHSEKAIQQMALYRLHRIAYPGDDFETTLIALKTSEDSELAERANAILTKLQSI